MNEATTAAAKVIERVLYDEQPGPKHTPPLATRARFIARALDDAGLLDATVLRDALVEIDTYLANDPDVWRLVSVAKAGDVLCDVLGAETIQAINASVEANLCAKCAVSVLGADTPRDAK